MQARHATVTIVGAGPRGLSVALYLLCEGQGMLRDVQVLERHAAAASWTAPAMPEAMRLRSPALHDLVAWHDPWRTWTFARFREAVLGGPPARPASLAALYGVSRREYHAYLQEVAERLGCVVPGAEVVAIERPQSAGADARSSTAADGLDLLVRCGGALRRLHSRWVVLATGMVGWGGGEFRRLPEEMTGGLEDGVHFSHSHGLTIAPLANAESVAVLGGGQSAAEAVARLLAETRVPVVWWLARRPPRPHLYPVPSQWFNDRHCGRFAGLPAEARRRLLAGALAWGPTISPFLHRELLHSPQPRLRTRFGCDVGAALPWRRRVRLMLRDGDMAQVDHLILATGYAFDVRRLPFLRPVLGDLLVDGPYPVLDEDFRAVTRAGAAPLPLFFTGAAAVLRDGPRQLFVNSSGVTAKRILAGMQRLFTTERSGNGSRSLQPAFLQRHESVRTSKP
ncbi:MAG: SidA/IucD/PvdA family monooxygenase [Candidatus Tectomicrobia bacterium]|nr:SidA/IucD/PvdA family monooxygenase [Candidatus Tectomicrobia bacterium]